jgi:hypothetical protein
MSNPFAGLSSPQRLLIIAPDSFLAAVQPLVAHKNFTGIPTVAVTIASLKSYFGTGLSGQPSATDDAEVIKLGIQYAHENLETKYVLLVGDSQNLPVRYWFGVGWGPPSWTGTDTLIPANPNGGFIQSDLYYANLYHHKGVYPNLAANGFDTWDEGSPGLYNQCNPIFPQTETNPNNVDGYPDLALGRVPAASADEVTAYVNKVIGYETASLGQTMPTISFVADKQYGSFDLTLNLAKSLQKTKGQPAAAINYFLIENYPNSLSLVGFNNQLFVAFIAEDGGGDLLIASSADGAHWTNLPNIGQKSVSGPALIDFSPAFSTSPSALWMAFVAYGVGGDGEVQLTHSASGGTGWSPVIHTGQNSQLTPALATLQNWLYLAYVEDDDSDQISVIGSADGKTWTLPSPVPNQNSCAAPALAAFTPAGSDTPLLWMAFITNDPTNKVFVCSSPNGLTEWSTIYQIGTQNNTGQSATSPALVVFDGLLYAAYVRGDGSYDVMVSSSADGKTWSTPTAIPGQKSKAAPTFAIFGQKLYIGLRGHNTQTLYICSLAPGANQSWSPNSALPDASALCPAPFISTAHTDLAAALSQSFYVSYIGHGGPGGWGHIELFSNQDLLGNTNWPMQPIVFAAACQTTLFAANTPWSATAYDGYAFTDVNGHLRGNFYAAPNAAPNLQGAVVYEGNPPTQTWGIGKDLTTAPPNQTSGNWALPVNVPLPNVYNSSPLNCIGKVWTIGCAPGGAIAYFGVHDVAPPGPDIEMEGYILTNYLQSAAPSAPLPGDHSLSGYPVLGDIYLQAQRTYWYAHQDLASTPGQEYHGIPRVYLGWLVLFGDPSLRLPPVATAKPVASKRLAQRVGDMDGDGLDEILVSSPWGIGILKQSGSTMICLASAASGTRIGAWLLDTESNDFPAIADFDGLGRAGIFVTSPWGIAILKYDAGALTVLASVASGTRLGQWVLNSEVNVFGPAADYDGDGVSEILVRSSWGVGILKYANGGFTSIAMTPNGTVNGGFTVDTGVMALGPVGNFDGSGRYSVQVSSPWGIAFLAIGVQATVVAFSAVQNGTDIGGWRLDTRSNVFSQAGNYSGGVVGSGGIGREELFVSSPWGVGILVMGEIMEALAVIPNGPLPGGWNLQTSSDVFGPTANYDGDSADEIFVTSAQGVGVLTLNRTTDNVNVPVAYELGATVVVPKGPCGAWSLDTAVDTLGSVGIYNTTHGETGAKQAGVFATSPWGIGVLMLSAYSGPSCPMLQPNGTRFVGGWLLDTSSDQF